MTTESGADSEAKQPQENKEANKGKATAAAEPTSPQNKPEQLPAAAGHSTPAKKEQVSLFVSTFFHHHLSDNVGSMKYHRARFASWHTFPY